MDLFDSVGSTAAGIPDVGTHSPLAVRMRPRSLEEVAGQSHLLEAGSPLRRLVEPPVAGVSRAAPSSVVLWGPPGTGKTTLAYLVAQVSGRRFVELSAVTAGVKEVRAVIDDARRRLASDGSETVLFIDEVHRFTKTQQDALLPSVENRWVTLVAATTENPSFSVNSPLLSRSLLLTLEPLSDDDVELLVARAVTDERGLAGAVELDEDAAAHLVRLAGGDARKALTILEAAAGAALDEASQDAVVGEEGEAVPVRIDGLSLRVLVDVVMAEDIPCTVVAGHGMPRADELAILDEHGARAACIDLIAPGAGPVDGHAIAEVVDRRAEDVHSLAVVDDAAGAAADRDARVAE